MSNRIWKNFVPEPALRIWHNPSIEPTATGKPVSVAHVERYAS